MFLRLPSPFTRDSFNNLLYLGIWPIAQPVESGPGSAPTWTKGRTARHAHAHADKLPGDGDDDSLHNW